MIHESPFFLWNIALCEWCLVVSMNPYLSYGILGALIVVSIGLILWLNLTSGNLRMCLITDAVCVLLQLGGPDKVAEITGRRGMLVRASNGKGVTYQARNT